MRNKEPEQPLPENVVQPPKQRMTSGAPARIEALIAQLGRYFRREPKNLHPTTRALLFLAAFQRQRVFCIPDGASIELYIRRKAVAAGWKRNADSLSARRALAEFHDESIKTAGGIARAQRQREQREAERAKHKRGK